MKKERVVCALGMLMLGLRRSPDMDGSSEDAGDGRKRTPKTLCQFSVSVPVEDPAAPEVKAWKEVASERFPRPSSVVSASIVIDERLHRKRRDRNADDGYAKDQGERQGLLSQTAWSRRDRRCTNEEARQSLEERVPRSFRKEARGPSALSKSICEGLDEA